MQTKLTDKTKRLLLISLGLAGLLGALFSPGIGPPPGHWFKTGWDALHLPGFALITWAVAHLLSRNMTVGRRIGIATGIAVVIALVSEYVHGFIGRSASMKDFSFDLIGIGFAAVLLNWWPRWDKKSKALFGMVIFLVLVAIFKPAWDYQLAENHNQTRFPDIGGFAHGDSLKLWRSQGNALVKQGADGDSLEIHIGQGKYGGVSYWPGVQDWTSCETLRLEIMNSGEPFLLGIRVDDGISSFNRSSQWFSDEVKVAEGTSMIQLSLQKIENGLRNRKLDTSKIVRLALFTGQETSGRVFIINSAFLK